jgi:3-hydroxyisobutyrate dehydrogenase-like beta-hydroxyacid dehydrogenase
MQIGMIGLGRMGANMVRRLLRGGHAAAVYDRSPEAVATLAAEGATAAPRSRSWPPPSRRRATSSSWCRRPWSTR